MPKVTRTTPWRGLTIDRKVPLPKKETAPRYPWAAMKVGDSFALPITEKRSAEGITRQLASSSARWCKSRKVNHRFTVRTIRGHKGLGMVRIWRVG